LGWFFIDREISAMTEELSNSGRLVSHNLAVETKRPLLAGDWERLTQLMQGAFTSEVVAYVLLTTSDGQVLSAQGKGEWKEFLADADSARRLAMINLGRDGEASTTRSMVIPERVVELKAGRVLEVDSSHHRTCWIRLLSGSLHPFVYQIASPIQSAPEGPVNDAALTLTLGEIPDDVSPITSKVLQHGYVLVGMSSVQGHSLLRKVSWQVIWITSFVIVLSLGIIVYLTRQMTTPLNALTSMAKRVAQGDLQASVDPRSHDEIGQLTKTFNQMTDALKTREDDLRELNRTLEARVHDRTQDLERANQGLMELDRLKTALVSNASHELRTPLTSIKMHIDNLLDGIAGQLPSQPEQTLRRVRDNVEQLRALIDDLLDLSCMQNGTMAFKPEEVGLGRIACEVVETLRYFSSDKNIRLTVDIPDAFPPVLADREKLRRILTNIIHNAVKFTPAGGRVRLAARQDNTDRVILSVEDSGGGIPSEDLEKIFLPFYRCNGHINKIRGSGLGLSITKELVALHKGRIWAQSTPGKGSTFFVQLSVAT